MPPLFITASGTDIGKTYVACLLLRAMRRRLLPVVVAKPVMSGYDTDAFAASDAGRLLAAAGKPVDAANIADICPWRFTAPVSPHLAAQEDQKSLHPAEVAQWCRRRIEAAAQNGEWLLIEGAGGVMTPLSTTKGMLELMVEIAIPVLLVAGTSLGAISHALAARRVIEAAHLPLLGAVISESIKPGAGLHETAQAITGWQGRDFPVFALPRQTLDADAPVPHAAEDEQVGDDLLDWLRERVPR